MARSEPWSLCGAPGLVFTHATWFEFVYLRALRRRVRLMLKRKKTLPRNRRLWLSLPSKFPITKKSKSSRMGKGCGSFVRWASRMPAWHRWLRLAGFARAKAAALLPRVRALFGPRVALSAPSRSRPSPAGPSLARSHTRNFLAN